MKYTLSDKSCKDVKLYNVYNEKSNLYSKSRPIDDKFADTLERAHHGPFVHQTSYYGARRYGVLNTVSKHRSFLKRTQIIYSFYLYVDIMKEITLDTCRYAKRKLVKRNT